MCQIIVNHGFTQLKEAKEQVKKAVQSNRDGSGLLYLSSRTADYFAPNHIPEVTDDPFIFHSRIATSGKNSRMLHPFKIGKCWLFHNGVMGGRFKGNDIFSDTAHLAEFLTQKGKHTLAKIKTFLEDMPELLGNRFALYQQGFEVAIVGEGWEYLDNGLICCGTGVCNYPTYSGWKQKKSIHSGITERFESVGGAKEW